jgi:hypothetical protein
MNLALEGGAMLVVFLVGLALGLVVLVLLWPDRPR